MNYFEIINKSLIELNYAPVSTFEELTKLEHKRLMNIINRLNKEICNLSDKFAFRQMMKSKVLYSDRIEYSIDFMGRISKILGQDGEYTYEPNYTKFYMTNPPKKSYCPYGEKFLFSPSDDRIKLFYVTNDFVIGKNEELKSDFEQENDRSIIPDNLAERLFVNGAAYNFKQNTAHPKYIHWKNEFDMGVKELMASSKTIVGSDVIIDGGYRKL